MPNPLDEVLRDALREMEREEAKKATAEELKSALATYQQPNTFAPGDIVRQKKGMKAYKRPETDEVAIVVDMQPGRVDKDGVSEGLFIGFPHNGTFIVHSVDENRFERVEKAEDEPS